MLVMFFLLLITQTTSQIFCDGLQYLFFVSEPTMMQACGDRNESFVMHFMNNNGQV